MAALQLAPAGINEARAFVAEHHRHLPRPQRRPRLLDLFCGAGGAAMGYHLAGFDVVGVDIDPQPHYPFEFHRADAMTYPLDGFDAIHASPPCQAYTLASGRARRITTHPEMVGPVRLRLDQHGAPRVIENVPQAPLIGPVTLCGTSFGLPILRHRSFECSFPVDAPSCGYAPTARVRHKDYTAHPYGRGSWEPAWREHVLPVVWPWMSIKEAGQAIPPVYTEWIGGHLLSFLSPAPGP